MLLAGFVHYVTENDRADYFWTEEFLNIRNQTDILC